MKVSTLHSLDLVIPILPQWLNLVKNPPTNTGDARNMGKIPGLGKSPGEENHKPFKYSCLENSMDKGVWRAAVPIRSERVRLSCSPMHVLTDIWWFIRHRFSTDFHVIQTSCLHLYTCDLRQIFSELFHVRVTLTEWSEVVAERIGSQESEHLDLDSKLSVLCLGAITSCLWASIPSSVKWK